MRLYKHIYEILLALIVILCCMSLHSCVSASSNIKPVSDAWKAVTDRGTFTADELNSFSATLAQAVASAAFFGQAAPVLKAISSPGTQSAIGTGVTVAGDVASGNWLGAIAQIAGVVAAAGGAGVVTYKKVMADRDASSPLRTASDMTQLGVPVPPANVAALVASQAMGSPPQPAGLVSGSASNPQQGMTAKPV